MDKIVDVAHLEREELGDRFGDAWVRDNCFELFDKAVAFSESCNDGHTDEVANSILRDFVLYLAETLRPRELHMMAVDKLASLNVSTADDDTMSLLYYAAQLSLKGAPDESHVTAL